jgi:hypothetical protein
MIRVAIAALLFGGCFVIGRLASGALVDRGSSSVRGGRSAPAVHATKSPTERRRRRGPVRLQALDVTLDQDELASFDQRRLAEIAAKKWADVLERKTREDMRYVDPEQALMEYFDGWMGLTSNTAPFGREQFAEGVRSVFCGEDRERRQLLEKLSRRTDIPVRGCEP